MSSKIKLTDYERLELKYRALEARYDLLMHFLNSKVYRRIFSKYLIWARKCRGLHFRDIILKQQNSKLKNKKKIALIIDKEDWAFANIATQIVKNLSIYYDFEVIQTDNIQNILDIILLVQECDLIHFFWRGMIYQMLEEHALKWHLKRLGIEYKSFFNDCIRPLNISTCIYDHIFLNSEEVHITKDIIHITDNYYVCSNILNEIYNKLPIEKKPSAIITDGIDLKKFMPNNLKRFDNISKRKVKIGWVGNSKWGDHDSRYKDTKGVNKILKPAIKQLIDEGYNIEQYFADSNEKMIPHDKMVDYYSGIDLYICTSEAEGTPNPVLEAMACGIPIISTHVGIVKELFGPHQRKFILETRTIDCLKEKIKELIGNPQLFKILSNENLCEINQWTWDEKCEDFKQYFDTCLRKGKNNEYSRKNKK